MNALPSFVVTLLLLGAAIGSFGEESIVQILTNGPKEKRINIVFLAEGYVQGQQNKFTADAHVLLDYILATPPLNGYSNHFNASAIFVASNEMGSDHPSASSYKDTYFNSSYDSYKMARFITIPPNDRDPNYSNGEGKIDALLQRLMPEYDLRVLVVNDSQFGGAGGDTLIASVDPASRETVVHEFGHTFAGLGDEYDSPLPGFPDAEEPNTTRETDPARIKWRDWISPTTPIPTPETAEYSGLIGLFEGAHYDPTGWYRPKLDCKMNHLGVPFCQVCSEAIIKATYRRLAGVIDSKTPATDSVTLPGNRAVIFAVTLLQPADHQLFVQWFMNGAAVAGATNTVFEATPSSLAAGVNVVRVEVLDPTVKVRTGRELLTDRASWTISPQVRPELSILQLPTGREVALTITGSEGGVYHLLRADELPAIAWSEVLSFTLAGPKTIALNTTNQAGFFKVIAE